MRTGNQCILQIVHTNVCFIPNRTTVFLVSCILDIRRFYPQVLCAFKSVSIKAQLHPHSRGRWQKATSPSILASLSIHNAMYDRSPPSSSSDAPFPLWHSVKQGTNTCKAFGLALFISLLDWQHTTTLPPSSSNLAASYGHLREQNSRGLPWVRSLQKVLRSIFQTAVRETGIKGHTADSAERCREWCAISLVYNLTPHTAPSHEFSSLI